MGSCLGKGEAGQEDNCCWDGRDRNRIKGPEDEAERKKKTLSFLMDVGLRELGAINVEANRFLYLC